MDNIIYHMAIFGRRTQSDRAGRPWLGLADLGGILCRAMVGATAPPVAPAVGLIIALSISHLTDDTCNQVSHPMLRKYVCRIQKSWLFSMHLGKMSMERKWRCGCFPRGQLGMIPSRCATPLGLGSFHSFSSRAWHTEAPDVGLAASLLPAHGRQRTKQNTSERERKGRSANTREREKNE